MAKVEARTGGLFSGCCAGPGINLARCGGDGQKSLAED